MKTVLLSRIRDKIKDLVQEANFRLGGDVIRHLETMESAEESEAGRDVFRQLKENAAIACEEKLALCQDTGLAVFFVELGEEVRLRKNEGLGSLRQAIEAGMIAGYEEGFLRKSVVSDPFDRKNTGNNAPAFIHWDVVPGDVLRIVFMAKGGGAENWSAIRMFAPADGLEAVENFIVDAVDRSGAAACPPLIIGVGVGGNFETAPLLAKKALLRKPLGAPQKNPFYAGMEERLLRRINDLGTGPQGLGGRITALAVHVESHPCHIASLPVALNVECHSHRIAELVI